MAESAARILIADDHPQGVELLEAYLSDTPYEMRTAANGDEALGPSSIGARTLSFWTS